MCVAIFEVKRNDNSSTEFIHIVDEADYTDRLDKLQASDTVVSIKIYKLAHTLTKSVTFVSSS